MKFLDDEERTRLRTQHKRERDGRVRDRIKAVLLYDKRWTYKQISEALLLTDEAIRNHIEEYKSQKKLRPQSGEKSSILFSLKNSNLIYKNILISMLRILLLTSK